MGELIIVLYVLGTLVAIFLFVLPIWFMLKSVKLLKKILESEERIERKIFRMDRERNLYSNPAVGEKVEKKSDDLVIEEEKKQPEEKEGDVEIYV